MNMVLFLGAGFSAAADLPVMKRCLRLILSDNEGRGEKLITASEKKFIQEMASVAYHADGKMAPPADDVDNFEHLLSIAQFDYAEDHQELEARPEDMLKSALFKVYSRLREHHARRLSEPLRNLCKTSASGWDGIDDISFLTTNYDLLIETCLVRQSPFKSLRLPFQWGRFEETGHSDSMYAPPQTKDGPVLCKLHGSLNWFACKNDDNVLRVEDRIELLSEEHGNTRREWLGPIQANCAYRLPWSPVIVPPSFFKERPLQQLETVWKVAWHRLVAADVIVFVGYSFPSSDVHMLYFLASALARKQPTFDVYCIDPEADAIRARLSQNSLLREGFLSRFKWRADRWENVGRAIP